MRERLKNILERLIALKTALKLWSASHKLLIFSFVFSFALMFSFIEVTLIRNAMIRQVKNELLRLQNYLNEFQLDLAYDHIEFNNIFFYPLVEVDNLQIYNLQGSELWKINISKITGRPGIFNVHKLNLNSSEMVAFNHGSDSTLIAADSTLKITTNSHNEFQTLHLRLRSADIKDFAKVEEIRLDVRNLNTIHHQSLITPSLESHFAISDAKLNGLLKYPLTSEIRRIYAKFNLMGSIFPEDSLYVGIENWLKNGGFIDIPRLIVNWEPLVLVGQGTVNFNEALQPRINITTSSKAMLNLLQDLQKNHFLDRKGVFVANILLNSKAFKLREEDKHLTLITPISYQDSKLAIENITIKSLAKP